MYKKYVHYWTVNWKNLQPSTKTVAYSRQNLASMITAAQEQPQVITKHDKPVAVLVSPDFLSKSLNGERSHAGFYEGLLSARKRFPPTDNDGLAKDLPSRETEWHRPNPFVVNAD